MPIAHTCFHARDVAKQPGDLESAAFHLYVSQPANLEVGKPMEVEITAVNVSAEPKFVRFDPTVLSLYMQQNGQSVPHSAKQRLILGEFQKDELPTYSGPIVTVPIQPGASFYRSFDLASYFQIAESGTYELCASFFQAHLTTTRTFTLQGSPKE